MFLVYSLYLYAYLLLISCFLCFLFSIFVYLLICFFIFLFVLYFFFFFFFFFSSRRRHTRSLRDWSSDVCSSDLLGSTDRNDRIASWRAIRSFRSVDPRSVPPGSWCARKMPSPGCTSWTSLRDRKSVV